MIIEQPAIWLRWLYPRATWRMDKHVKAVYLTFDDGPIPEATPFILDTLAEYGVKATFFMVGDNVRKYPAFFLLIKNVFPSVENFTSGNLFSLIISVSKEVITFFVSSLYRLNHTNSFPLLRKSRMHHSLKLNVLPCERIPFKQLNSAL